MAKYKISIIQKDNQTQHSADSTFEVSLCNLNNKKIIYGVDTNIDCIVNHIYEMLNPIAFEDQFSDNDVFVLYTRHYDNKMDSTIEETNDIYDTSEIFIYTSDYIQNLELLKLSI